MPLKDEIVLSTRQFLDSRLLPLLLHFHCLHPFLKLVFEGSKRFNILKTKNNTTEIIMTGNMIISCKTAPTKRKSNTQYSMENTKKGKQKQEKTELRKRETLYFFNSFFTKEIIYYYLHLFQFKLVFRYLFSFDIHPICGQYPIPRFSAPLLLL